MWQDSYFLIVTQEDGLKSYSRLVTHENFGLNLEMNGDRGVVLKRFVDAIQSGEAIGSEVYNADKVSKVGIKRLRIANMYNPLHGGEINDDIQLKIEGNSIKYVAMSEAYHAEHKLYEG